MSLIKKIAFGIIIIGILGLLTVKMYLHHDLPPYEGTIYLGSIQDTVDVFTDSYGTPHIFARNESDLFFSAGYISARERLFQMTTIASAVRGELSLLFGDGMLEDDIYLRTWGIPAMAKQLAKAMDPDVKVLVQRFCDGINTRIEELISNGIPRGGNNLPLEFKLLQVKPCYWRVADVAGYSRLMAHDLQQSWKPEILFGAVLEYFGEEKLQELLPRYDDNRPTIAIESNGVYQQLFSVLWKRETAIRDLTGTGGSSVGSNNWVISGKRTATGKPILANDPHLQFTQPAKWYEMHLKGGRFNVSGVCLAGLPVPVIGQNESCAWGFTNTMADDIDFFIETVNPEKPNQYLSGNQWLDMNIVEEQIPLKDGQDTVVVIRSTHHGPVISDLHPLLRGGNKVVSMQWTGHQMTKEIPALFHLSLMRNWEDFSQAAAEFSVPGQNIVYADTAGNIGWRPAVKIPLRKEGDRLVPRPGSDREYDWTGTIPFEEMPFLYNPDDGVIATANNKTIGNDYPYYISNLWADPSRITRIKELIGDLESIGVNDVKTIQTDVVSPYSRELVPFLVNAAGGDESDNLKHAIRLLESWTGNESKESTAALVFHATLNRLLYNIYKDELDLIGEYAFKAYIAFPMIPHRNLLWTLKYGSSSWLDDISTPNYVETSEDIIRKSLKEAVEMIEQITGVNPANWAWGNVHTLTHPHTLGRIKLLDALFDLNVGPFPTGGSSLTINNGEYQNTKPFRQVVGPSMRRIVDFSDLNRTQFILPTGQSGLHNSPHYRDQANLFNNGEYRTTYFDEDFIRQSDEFRHLVIIPENVKETTK